MLEQVTLCDVGFQSSTNLRTCGNFFLVILHTLWGYWHAQAKNSITSRGRKWLITIIPLPSQRINQLFPSSACDCIFSCAHSILICMFKITSKKLPHFGNYSPTLELYSSQTYLFIRKAQHYFFLLIASTCKNSQALKKNIEIFSL